MKHSNQHIIARQILDLNLLTTESNFDLQQRMSKYFWAEITPVLESVFDKYVGAEDVILIDKLELDLGEIELENLETEFVKRLKIQLEEMLTKQLIVEQTTTTQSKKEHFFEAWLHFLTTGTLPWFVKKMDETLRQNVLATLEYSWVAARRLQQVLQGNPRAMKRLIYQEKDVFLQSITAIFTKKEQDALVKISQQILYWVDILEKDAVSLLKENDFSKKEYVDFKKELKTIENWRLPFWESILKRAVVEQKMETALKLVTPFFNDFLNRQKAEVYFKIMVTSIAKKEKLDTLFPILATHFIEKIGKKNFYRLGKQIALNPSDIQFGEWQKRLEKKLDNSTRKVEKEIFEIKETPTLNTVVDESQESHDIPKFDNKAKPTNPSESTAFTQNEALSFEKSKSQNNPKLTTKKTIQDHQLTIKSGSSWYIDHAGVVLLHVFISRLFENLSLVEKAKFKNENARQRAVYLIQFLATRQEEMPEYELLLAKLLCGMPFEIPVAQAIALTTEEKTACEDLLTAAIKHWNALGKSSPDALREGFLSRAGKLEKRENGWHLTVEKKTIDILLNQLPWNIGTIKLPWMKDILWVDWK